MSKENINMAMLIDADNAQASYFAKMIEETSIYGRIIIKRVYGDWTAPQMNQWKDQLNEYSIKPMQNFAYTKGKNATDIAMIIDAMDILHRENVEGFCIVSSDSDFTGLATRIKESGLFVMGIGRKTTPKSFINACDIFRFVENFTTQKPKRNKKPQTNIKPEEEEEVTIDIDLLKNAVERKAQENGTAFLSQVSQEIIKLEPTFNLEDYGFKNYSQLFKSLDSHFELISHEDKTTFSVKVK